MHLEYRCDDEVADRVVVSSSAWAGRLTLYAPSGRVLNQHHLPQVDAVQFVERYQRRPFIQVLTRGHGTGVSSRELTWYCVDRHKLEEVLTISVEANNFIPSVPPGGPEQDRIEHEDSQLQIVQPRGAPYIFEHPVWPVVRVRTTQLTWYDEDHTEKFARTANTQVTETQWEFTPATRRYRVTSQRVLTPPSAPEGDPPDHATK